MATTKEYSNVGTLVFSPNKYIEDYRNVSTSNKVGKRVRLNKAAPHEFDHRKVIGQGYRGSYNGTPEMLSVRAATVSADSSIVDKAEQIALAKFQGKLRKGDASLGVSLASWAQSRDMIISRFGKLNPLLSKTEYELRERRKRRETLKRKIRNTAELRASDVLEVEFGWLPLIADVHAALNTVCQDGIPPSWVVGRHRYVVPILQQSSTDRFSGAAAGLVTVAAAVNISNPNLWLLNRLGLINPATVIWDLIPWSFVVNMFVNVNAMISSVTNEVGLDISERSVTRTQSIVYTQERWDSTLGPNLGPKNAGWCECTRKMKSRTVGSFPSTKWSVKVPNLNWELALIASSLAVQKLRAIDRFIQPLVHSARSSRYTE